MNTSKLNRRNVLKAVVGSAGLLTISSGRLFAEADEGEKPLFSLREKFPSPVKIASVELLRRDQHYFVQITSQDGNTGTVLASQRMAYLYPIFLQRIAPYFVGKDARDLEALVDGVYVHQSNYKLAGLPFWVCVGCLEFAVLDLLGRLAGKSIGELMGGVVRREIPVYLSSMRRDTTPEQDVAWLTERLSETGAKAVKLKIGGRMRRNAEIPGGEIRATLLVRPAPGDPQRRGPGSRRTRHRDHDRPRLPQAGGAVRGLRITSNICWMVCSKRGRPPNSIPKPRSFSVTIWCFAAPGAP